MLYFSHCLEKRQWHVFTYDFSKKNVMFLKLNSYFLGGKKKYFEDYGANINSKFTGSVTLRANKNSVSIITKPPAQIMFFYMMSVMSLLVSVVRQQKAKKKAISFTKFVFVRVFVSRK